MTPSEQVRLFGEPFGTGAAQERIPHCGQRMLHAAPRSGEARASEETAGLKVAPQLPHW
jgi:hypothetical protein